MSVSPSTSADFSAPKARVVLITGAARRIGRGVALGFAARGWGVAVDFGGCEGEAQEVIQSIRALGRRAVALHADLGIESDVARLVPACMDALGGLHCVVNNASSF